MRSQDPNPQRDASDRPQAAGDQRPELGAARRRVLGFDTLRGRFVLMAALVLVLLVVLASILSWRVQQVSSENTANIQDRHDLSAITRDMSDDLWHAGKILQSYLRQPADELRRQYDGLLVQLAGKAAAVAGNSWVQRTAELHDQTRQLEQDLQRLRTEAGILMEIRANPERMYPAMPLMLGKMQVYVQQFTTSATLAIDEANEFAAAPGQLDALRLFYDTLYAWSRTVDAFRLYVADRFGVFSITPEAAMRTQATVVEDFSDRIRRNFTQLDTLDKRGLLQFQQAESLREMQMQHRLWTQSWHEVAPIWISENWRRDRPVLQTTVLPIEKRVWDTVGMIEKTVDAYSAKDLSLIAQLARRLSGSLWLVVLMGLVVAGIIFLAFEIQIRRPIARVAAALKAEAAGEENVSVPETRLVETRELNQAFDHMRRQVRVRQERLQAVLESAAEAIITIGERGLIEGFNPAAEQLFGYSAAEVLGRNISLLMPEPERSRHDGYLERYRQAGGSRVLGCEREEQGLHKDGRVFPVSLKVSEAAIDGRRVFIGMLADISERKALFGQMEAMLEQINTREQRLHTILDNTAEGIITFDERGAIEADVTVTRLDTDRFMVVTTGTSTIRDLDWLRREIPADAVPTDLEVRFLDHVGFEASSTQVRNGQHTLMPHAAFEHAGRKELYGVPPAPVKK